MSAAAGVRERGVIQMRKRKIGVTGILAVMMLSTAVGGRAQAAEMSGAAAQAKEDSKPVKMSFELTDFNLLGYDLFGDHFEEICEEAGCPVQELSPSLKAVNSVFGKAQAWYSGDLGGNMRTIEFLPKEDYSLRWTTDLSGNTIRCYRNSLFTEPESTEEMSAYLDISSVSNSPVTLGDSYEEWLKLINFDAIQKNGVQSKCDEIEEHTGDIVNEYWFRTEWGNARYLEWLTRFKEGDDALYCGLSIYLTGEDDGGPADDGEEECFGIGVIFDSNEKIGSWNVTLEYGNESYLY